MSNSQCCGNSYHSAKELDSPSRHKGSFHGFSTRERYHAVLSKYALARERR